MKLKNILASLVAGVTLATAAMPASAWVAAGRGGHGGYVAAGGYHGGYGGGYRGGYYGGGGCYGCGVGAAIIGGAIIGGAIANSYAQPYYAPAPVYVQPPVVVTPPPVYVAPQPRWHWEQQYDASCNCVRNIQVMD